MSRRTTGLLKAALSALYYSGADGLMAPFTSGCGVIFMLHHVRPEAPADFEPNRILRITPDFLETVINQVLDTGFDVLSLDQVSARLATGGRTRPFACFTFDDGYRDNRDFAYPIFKRYNLPFAIYVPTDYADGRGDLWWLTLERVLQRAPSIAVRMNGALRHFRTVTGAQKDAAFHEIYWWLREIPEDTARAVVAELARATGYDPSRQCADLVMSWDELRELAADPIVTIGAHTMTHRALAKLSAHEARSEIEDSVRRIEAELGRPCRHFSYPYGSESSAGHREFEIARELGLETAVTTRKGLLFASHAQALTALPRLSLNGDFQDERYLRVMLSGAPFAFWNAVRRVTSTHASA